LPEIHRPHRLPEKSDRASDSPLVLVFIVLFFTLVFGYRYVHTPVPSTAVAAVPMQSQMPQPVAPKASALPAGNHFIASHDNFGWLAFIAKPLYLALRFLYSHGVGNWGWAIIVLTVMFNLLTVWPRVLSTKSSLKMMRIQPKVGAIKKRYAHLALSDPRRADMNVETMALYKAEGGKHVRRVPAVGLAMPLLFGYMRVLRSAPELHYAHWYWLKDLSSPDPLHILPLLIIASMVLTQFVTPAPTMTSSQRWMLGLLMPAAMGFSLWHYASGLSLYWITGNIVSLAIQFWRSIKARQERRYATLPPSAPGLTREFDRDRE
jgi:YidC/Oxa1 family membrane protein insertase